MQQLIQKRQEQKYMLKKKETRGGKRAASGRKKADYETKTIAFRVRVEFVERVKKLVKDAVAEWLQNIS
jgi:hypothetical protein